MKKPMLMLLLLLLLVSGAKAQAAAFSLPVTAKSAILMEAKTGRVLMEKNAQARAFPASTTKMATGILAMESGKLTDAVTVSQRAAETEGSSIWLEAGEQLTLEQLCYGLMLHSGNDAANAIAEYLGGSEGDFVAQMNALAKRAGATDTHFANANGLPDNNHYSTAHDLAKIAAYGLRNPAFKKVVATDHAIIPWGGKPFQRELYNSNHLLATFDGANGVKTGYTEVAGHCLVASAQRNGLQLIAVVLDSEDMWRDSAALLEAGFNRLKPVNFLGAGQPLTMAPVLFGEREQVAVGPGQTLVLPAPEAADDYRYEINSGKLLAYPPQQGEAAGSVRVYYREQLIDEVPLYYLENTPKASLFVSAARLLRATKQQLVRSLGEWLPGGAASAA